jgi:hypothetical protein
LGTGDWEEEDLLVEADREEPDLQKESVFLPIVVLSSGRDAVI